MISCHLQRALRAAASGVAFAAAASAIATAAATAT